MLSTVKKSWLDLKAALIAICWVFFAALPSLASEADLLVPNPDVEWYQNIVPKGRVGGGYHHGQFLIAQQLTHPGVDIGGGCRLAVYAADSGDVVKIVKRGDRDFGAVGNAVVIKHANVGGKPVFSAYFHMDDAPLVRKGPIKRGKKIGLTGATGNARGCHLHFEVRHFAGIRGLYNPDWRNIYGKGDQRRDPEFLAGWSDPETWVAGMMANRTPVQSEVEIPNGRKDDVPAITKTFRSFENQGIQFTMTVSFVPVEEGVLVRLVSATGRQVSGATFNPVDTNESFALGLRVVTRKICQDCKPDFVKDSPLGLQLKDRRLELYGLPVEVFAPDVALADADVIDVALYGNGLLFLAPESNISIDELKSGANNRGVSADYRQKFIHRILTCWNIASLPDSAPSVTVQFDLSRNGRVQSDIRLLSSSAATGAETKVAFNAARRAILRCQLPDGYQLPPVEYESWRTIMATFNPSKHWISSTETVLPAPPTPPTPDKPYISKLADYIETSGTDAISTLSGGVRLAFKPSESSFRAGKVTMSNSSVPTTATQAVDSLNQKFSWQGWMDVTQGNNPTAKSVRVICQFEPDDPGLGSAFSVVNAKLLEYTDRTAVFACATF